MAGRRRVSGAASSIIARGRLRGKCRREAAARAKSKAGKTFRFFRLHGSLASDRAPQ
ncbi:hypothetical protein BN871_AF_00440 [Paenibacillus sp. P22]|nr:hypothetical protein BN871_AF_00440 [Paenibacillus sp. P22]